MWFVSSSGCGGVLCVVFSMVVLVQCAALFLDPALVV